MSRIQRPLRPASVLSMMMMMMNDDDDENTRYQKYHACQECSLSISARCENV